MSQNLPLSSRTPIRDLPSVHYFVNCLWLDFWAGRNGRSRFKTGMTSRYAVCRVGQAQHPAKTSPDSDQQTPINSYVSKSSIVIADPDPRSPVIVMSQNPPIVIADFDPRSPICALLCELKMAGFLAQAGMGDPGSRPG